jgi:hypothetical protein
MFKQNEVHGKHAAHAKGAAGESAQAKEKAEAPEVHEAAESATQETVRMGVLRDDTPSQKGKDADAETRTASVEAPSPEAMPQGTSEAVAPVPAFQAAPTVAHAPEGTDTPLWTPINPDELHKSHVGRNVGIGVGVIAGALLVAYVAGGIFFSSHFYPGTSLNGQDVSLKSQNEVAEVVNQIATDYSIDVSGGGLDFTVSSADMGIEVDGANVAAKAMAENNPWTWPAQVNSSHDITEHMLAEYNAAGLQEAVTANVETWNEEATDPVDATLEYDESSHSYQIAKEQPGTKFDVEKVLAVVDDAVMEMKPAVELGEDQLTKPSVLSDNEQLLKAQETANGYVQADLHLVLGNESEVKEIDADLISQWVRLDDDLNVTFDDEAMDGWLVEFGNGLDTVGSERTYTRPDGKEVTVDGGTYGWEIDTSALVDLVHEEIKNGTQGDVAVPWISGAAFYNGPGAVDWSDYIDVDLSEQHAYYYTGDGECLWESDVISGIPDGKHDTPTGIWTLFSMESPATLKGEIQESTGAPEYETQVQYWMPFTYSGCGLHDATWQPAFGGSLYSQGYGSHGCVNLSYDAAESLYGIATVGIPVIVHW